MDEQIDSHEQELWSLYHENSKVTSLDPHPNEESVVKRMQSMAESLEFTGYPIVSLPPSRHLHMSVTESIRRRVSARTLTTVEVSGDELATILDSSFGMSRSNVDTPFPRPFRVAPSGGALYPIEPFVYCRSVQDIDPGLYHFSVSEGHLRRINSSAAMSDEIANAFQQSELARVASAILLMAGFFARSTFKYGERAYRFVLIEAGHIGQNIALVSTGLGLSCVTVGGFFDRALDATLNFDGVWQSVIYSVLIGGPRTEGA